MEATDENSLHAARARTLNRFPIYIMGHRDSLSYIILSWPQCYAQKVMRSVIQVNYLKGLKLL